LKEWVMDGQGPSGFEDLIDRWVEGAVRAGARDFRRLIWALPGVYPASARDSLRRLAAQGAVPPALSKRLVEETETRNPGSTTIPGRFDLPIPHPLDYEWRYADAATDRLLDEWDASENLSGSLTLLGAPSVALRAVRRVPRRGVCVLDANAAVISALRRICPEARVQLCDLMRGELPRVPRAAVVVSDPPWYPEHLASFLWAACKLCRPRGRVLVSLPPLGPRPGMPEERALFLGLAKRMGLRLDRLDEGALPYVSPPFELNALRADRLPGVPLDWRRGDLAVFVRYGGDPGPRPPAPPREEGWREVAVLGVRIRVRHDTVAEFEDPSLVPIEPGDVLPTVSRRDPRRREADVWTAGNRVYGCQAPGILFQILRALSAGDLPVERVAAAIGRALSPAEAGLVGRGSERVADLVHLEQDEQAVWREWCRREGLFAIAV
jgi:hypothetical protein